MLNRVYANILGRPVLVPETSVVSLGSSIFAFLAAGTFNTIEDAQEAICPPHRVYEPDTSCQTVYEDLYAIYRELYFDFGDPAKGKFANVLPALMKTAALANKKVAATVAKK